MLYIFTKDILETKQFLFFIFLSSAFISRLAMCQVGTCIATQEISTMPSPDQFHIGHFSRIVIVFPTHFSNHS